MYYDFDDIAIDDLAVPILQRMARKGLGQDYPLPRLKLDLVKLVKTLKLAGPAGLRVNPNPLAPHTAAPTKTHSPNENASHRVPRPAQSLVYSPVGDRPDRPAVQRRAPMGEADHAMFRRISAAKERRAHYSTDS